MARKDAAKASGLPVDRYRKEIGKLLKYISGNCNLQYL